MNYKNLLSTTALLFSISVASSNALPVGGVVQNGAATIANTASKTTITQTTGRVDIDWTGFDVTAGQQVQFVQPSTSSVAINRISGGATSIAGTLTANGRVVLMNTNGITFVSGSQVNVGSLIATTSASPIDDSELAPSSLSFYRSSKTAGAIVNNGTIRVPVGGKVAFIAPVVTNTGIITQKVGATGKINVDLYGGEFRTVSFASAPSVGYSIPTSKLATISVTNSGTINTGGGVVALTATDAATIAGSVMNLSGVIDSSSLSTSVGGGSILARSAGNLTSSASMNANAYGENSTFARGGTVSLTAGKDMAVTGNISANGSVNAQGGTIALVATTGSMTKGDSTTFDASGGTEQGKGGSISLAAKTTLTVGGTLNASAPVLGDGGSIALRATDSTLTRRSGLNLNAAGGLDSTDDTNAGKGGSITYYVKNNTMLASGVNASGVTVNASPRSDSGANGLVKVDYSTGTDVITNCTFVNPGC